MKLSIIIPLYNEESQIQNTLQEISRLELPNFITDKEIIVVDDGSTDNSASLVKAFISKNPSALLISHTKNKGKGAAIRSGIDHAKGEVIVFQDADMELIPQDINSMLEAMQSLDLKLVNGSRYLAGVIRPLFSFRRYTVNQLFTWLTSVVVNVKFTDVACGYKIVKADFLRSIQLVENRFGFETELMIKASRNCNIREIAEVPVHYSPRSITEGKKIRNIDGIKILWAIVKYGIFRV